MENSIKTACATKIDEKTILVVTFLAKDRFWVDFWTQNGTQKWLKLDPEIQDLGSIGPGGSWGAPRADFNIIFIDFLLIFSSFGEAF